MVQNARSHYSVRYRNFQESWIRLAYATSPLCHCLPLLLFVVLRLWLFFYSGNHLSLSTYMVRFSNEDWYMHLAHFENWKGQSNKPSAI